MNFDKLKISLASKNHIPALKRIWSLCFGDSGEYIDFFFNNRFASCDAVVAEYEEKIIGAAYLMPVQCFEYDVIKNGRYGYAIGIEPNFRGNGIYAVMNSKILNVLKSKNEFYIICPANKKLCQYYHSIGFTEFSRLCQTEMQKENLKLNLSLKPITPHRYCELRNKYFPADGFIIWNEEAVRYAIDENSLCGGFTAEISDGCSSYAVMAREYDGRLKIIESTVPPNLTREANSLLCKKYGFSSAVWTRPAYEMTRGETFLSGMCCNLKKPEFPYLNLVMD